jgi:hypothetical protein
MVIAIEFWADLRNWAECPASIGVVPAGLGRRDRPLFEVQPVKDVLIG